MNHQDFSNKIARPIAEAILIDIENGAVTPVPLPSSEPFKTSPSSILASEQDQKAETDPTALKTSQRRERLRMGFVRWAFTFLTFWWLVEKIWGRVFGPGYDVFVSRLKEHERTKERIAESFTQCIHDEGERCRSAIATTRDFELTVLDAVHASNQARVNEVTRTQQQCYQEYSVALMPLIDLVLSGRNIPFLSSPTSTCTAKDKESIISAAGGDTQAAQEVALASLAQFRSEILAEVENVAKYAGERAVYDYNYFIGVLVEPLQNLTVRLGQFPDAFGNLDLNARLLSELELFLACIHPRNGDSVRCPVPTFSARIEIEILGLIRPKLDFLSTQLRLGQLSINNLIGEFNGLRVNYLKLFRAVLNMRDFLGPLFTSAWTTRVGIELKLPDIGRAEINILPDFDLDFNPNLGPLPSIQPIVDELLRRAKNLKDIVIEAAENATEVVVDKIVYVKNEIIEYLTLEDYYPPQFRGLNDSDLAEDIRDDLLESSRPSYDNVVASIYEIGDSSTNFSVAKTYIPPPVTVNLQNVTGNVQQSSTDWLAILIPDLPPLFNSLYMLALFIWSIRYWLDVAYRIYLFLNHYKHYYDEGSIPMPEVIVGRLTSQPGRQDKREEKAWYDKLLTSPLGSIWIKRIVAGIVLLALLFVGSLAANAYFGHYQRSCVYSKTGTFVARAIVSPVQTNRVIFDGQQARTSEHLRTQLYQASQCRTAVQSTTSVDVQLQTQMDLLDNDHNKTIAKVAPLLRCVDFDAVGGFDPARYEELSDCAQPVSTSLQDGIATCDWGDCEIQCSRDDIEEMIRLEVAETACIVEWHFHANAAIAVLVMIQFAIIRVTCTWLEAAYIRLRWQHLRNAAVIVKYAHSIDTGRPLNIKDKDLDTATRKAIDIRLKRLKYVAYLYIAGSVFLNALWISLPVVLRVMDFDPWRPEWYEG